MKIFNVLLNLKQGLNSVSCKPFRSEISAVKYIRKVCRTNDLKINKAYGIINSVACYEVVDTYNNRMVISIHEQQLK